MRKVFNNFKLKEGTLNSLKKSHLLEIWSQETVKPLGDTGSVEGPLGSRFLAHHDPTTKKPKTLRTVAKSCQISESYRPQVLNNNSSFHLQFSKSDNCSHVLKSTVRFFKPVNFYLTFSDNKINIRLMQLWLNNNFFKYNDFQSQLNSKKFT